MGPLKPSRQRPAAEPLSDGPVCWRRRRFPDQEGTFEVKRNRSRSRVVVSADDANVVGHAGVRLLSDLADACGLGCGLSAAMGPTKQRRRGHDRGDVLVDLALSIAGGGEAIA